MQRGNTLENLPSSLDAQRGAVERARKALASIILGKDEQITLALSCLLARVSASKRVSIIRQAYIMRVLFNLCRTRFTQLEL